MTSETAQPTSQERPDLLEIAEAIAPGWERRRPFVEGVTAPVRRWLIDALAPSAGDTVLELACGAGDTGFGIASLVGERGRLIASDFAPAMLDVARRRGRELGVDNVDYRLIDAHRIELDTESIDGVVCRYGYMLMADPATALAETRRVLRPGGRLVLAVWGPPERNPFFALLGRTLVEGGHAPPPDPAAPGPFSMASAERTSALLRGAGFSDVRCEEVGVRFAFAGVDEYLAIAADTAGPLAFVLRSLPEDARADVRAELERAIAPHTTESGYELPGVTLCARAS